MQAGVSGKVYSFNITVIKELGNRLFFIHIFKKGTYMRLIEYRGGCMSGYVPERPKSIRRCGGMPCLILIP